MTAPMAVSHPGSEHLDPLHAALLSELDAQRAQLTDLQTTVDELTGEHAMQRIAAGTYGRCERCDGAIARDRLEAIPHARLCVTCPPTSTRLLA